MDPLRLPLVWRSNAPDPEVWTITADDGAPVDLTGHTLEMQVKHAPGAAGGAALFTLSMAAEGAAGFYLSDAADGEVTITPPTAAQLLPISPSVLAYDVLLIAPDGKYEIILTGSVTIEDGVTLL